LDLGDMSTLESLAPTRPTVTGIPMERAKHVRAGRLGVFSVLAAPASMACTGPRRAPASAARNHGSDLKIVIFPVYC
jgi:hypothetical protein